MASLNKVLLIGNLTRDPELRYIPSGTAVASFSIAVNRVYKLPTGEKKEEVSFIRVVVWGKMGENCAEYLKKGRPVFVEGRLQSRTWDGQDGQKRSTVEVIASAVQFLGTGGGRSSEGGDVEYSSSRASSGSAGSGRKDSLEEINLDMPSEPPTDSGEDVVPF